MSCKPEPKHNLMHASLHWLKMWFSWVHLARIIGIFVHMLSVSAFYSLTFPHINVVPFLGVLWYCLSLCPQPLPSHIMPPSLDQCTKSVFPSAAALSRMSPAYCQFVLFITAERNKNFTAHVLFTYLREQVERLSRWACSALFSNCFSI